MFVCVDVFFFCSSSTLSFIAGLRYGESAARLSWKVSSVRALSTWKAETKRAR